MEVAPNSSRLVAVCCLVVLIALYVVGAVRDGFPRYFVQTLPLWIPILSGFLGREWAKWAALPCLSFWLAIMLLVWMFLQHMSLIVGQFSPVEVAMMVIIGGACIAGLFAVLRWRTAIRPATATAIILVFAVLQLLLFRISLLPSIAPK